LAKNGLRFTQYPSYRGAIQPYAVTLAEVLKAAGYRTAMSGKWHVGDRVSPIERGFDDFYGFTRGYGVDSFDPQRNDGQIWRGVWRRLREWSPGWIATSGDSSPT
jgi:arylsulfatase A-like enzyme